MGVRKGGVAIGLWGGVGVLLLASFFHITPGLIPISAIGIIFAVVSAAAAMQMAGGVDYLVQVAQHILRRHPERITYLAPLVSWVFAIGAGTGNIYYSLLPVIEEVALKNKIRPERPLALSPVASQLAITSSPMSAAMAIMVTKMEPAGISLFEILAIVIPATFIAIVVAAFIQSKIGKELEEDSEYQKRKSEIYFDRSIDTETQTISPYAKKSVLIFLSGVVSVVVLSAFQSLRPHILSDEGVLAPMGMSFLIMLIMSFVAVLILLICRVDTKSIPKSNIFRSGLVSVIALFGVAWMANTFIGANKELLVSELANLAHVSPIIFAFAVFVFAAMTTSQSSTTIVLIPVGLTLGIDPHYIVAMWLAAIGIYFFPANGSQIATLQFDRSGTVKIGRLVLNHSFMLPTLVCATVAVGSAMLIARILF